MLINRVRHSRLYSLLAIAVIVLPSVSTGVGESRALLKQGSGWPSKTSAYTLNEVKFKYPGDFKLQQLSGVEKEAVAMIDKRQDWGIFVAAPVGSFDRDKVVERVRAAIIEALLPKESKDFSWTEAEIMYTAGDFKAPPQDAHKLSRYDTDQKLFQGYNKNVLMYFEVHQLELNKRIILAGYFYVGARGNEAKEAVRNGAMFGSMMPVMACASTISSITGEKPFPVGLAGGPPSPR